MPRYLVIREFKAGLHVPMDEQGEAAFKQIVSRNGDAGVTWVHSYVNEDKTKTFCIYDAPNAEAIRQVAQANGLPVDEITKVSVLDPYFYH